MNSEMIEIFLFIDPLGNECCKTVQTLSHVLEDRKEKIIFRIIPIVNIHKIKKAVKQGSFVTEGSSLDRQNHLYMNTYQAALAFIAASMQGKQKGEVLLQLLQEKVVHDHQIYSENLLLDIVRQMDLDWETFIEDFHSDLAKSCFQRNQKLAAEMNIHCTPSCVVIHTSDIRRAYRLDDKIEESTLNYLIDLNHPNQNCHYYYF